MLMQSTRRGESICFIHHPPMLPLGEPWTLTARRDFHSERRRCTGASPSRPPACIFSASIKAVVSRLCVLSGGWGVGDKVALRGWLSVRRLSFPFFLNSYNPILPSSSQTSTTLSSCRGLQSFAGTPLAHPSAKGAKRLQRAGAPSPLLLFTAPTIDGAIWGSPAVGSSLFWGLTCQRSLSARLSCN